MEEDGKVRSCRARCRLLSSMFLPALSQKSAYQSSPTPTTQFFKKERPRSPFSSPLARSASSAEPSCVLKSWVWSHFNHSTILLVNPTSIPSVPSVKSLDILDQPPRQISPPPSSGSSPTAPPRTSLPVSTSFSTASPTSSPRAARISSSGAQSVAHHLSFNVQCSMRKGLSARLKITSGGLQEGLAQRRRDAKFGFPQSSPLFLRLGGLARNPLLPLGCHLARGWSRRVE